MRSLRVTALSLLVVLGAACGSAPSTSGTDALQLISASADATTSAGSALMSMEMEMETPEGGFSMTAEGGTDFETRQGEMTMQMDMPAAAGMGSMEIEVVMDGLVMYMKYPEMLMGQMPGGKAWVRMDLEALAEGSGMDMGSLMQSGGSDPAQMLEWLRGVSGDVEVVGEEEVRGVPATHYKGTMDFNKIAEQAPEELRETMKASVDAMVEAVGVSEMPFDVWIDGEGRAVRFSQNYEFTKGATAGASMSVVIEYFDFGAPVEIEIPPADETMDFSELMGGMGASATP